MSRSSAFCTALDTCLPQSATLVWNATRPARSALHDRYLVGGCRACAPFGQADPAASLPRQACEDIGCVDLFMEVWTHAHTVMHAKFGDLGDLGDLGGTMPGAALAYLTTSARSRLAELNRQQRVARGGVAKPQRGDGTVGRVARSFGDPWLADVFRFLLGYAASAGRHADGWPLDVLTQRKNAWDAGDRAVGSAPARAESRADVASCLATVRREAGDGWLYECILLPLANRAGLAAFPADAADTLPSIEHGSDARLGEAATAMLDELVRRMRTDAGPGTALRAVVDDWLGDDQPPREWARKRADDLAMLRLAKSLIAGLACREAA